MFRAAALALLATLTHGESAQPRRDAEYLRKLSPSHQGNHQERRRRLIDVTSSSQTASDLANVLVGDGVTVSAATLECASNAYGTFSNGFLPFGINQGIILSSGSAVHIQGPNLEDGKTSTNDWPGDADLDLLTAPYSTTQDACSLEFTFSCDTDPQGFSFQYVFASEEYNEWALSSFNDVFGFYLDGANIALIPNTTIPVSINTINCGNPYSNTTTGSYCNLFVNNDIQDGNPGLNTEADGFTVPLTVTQPSLGSGMHTIKLVIADTADTALDSHVLIQAGSLVCAPPPLSSAGPSESPSTYPSVSPSASPSTSSSEPSTNPSGSPTVYCASCDFDDLRVIGNSASRSKVTYYCGMNVTYYNTTARFITVFDSQSPRRNTTNRKYDPDLGSPSRTCGGVGLGLGGNVGQTWENCEPLGNVIVLQDRRYSFPNDNGSGGCMKFKFDYPITNLTLGLLDIDATENATITLYNNSQTIIDTFVVPKVGDNGYWTSDSPKNNDTHLAGIAAARHVTTLTVCLTGSGALTHVNYCSDAY